MKYAMEKHSVIYIQPVNKEIEFTILSGSVWLTIQGDIRDRILGVKDRLRLIKTGKIAIQAIDDACFLIKGKKFLLHELIQKDRQMVINRINIGQTGQQRWTRFRNRFLFALFRGLNIYCTGTTRVTQV